MLLHGSFIAFASLSADKPFIGKDSGLILGTLHHRISIDILFLKRFFHGVTQ
jgi:hypothetical protein